LDITINLRIFIYIFHYQQHLHLPHLSIQVRRKHVKLVPDCSYSHQYYST